MALFGFSAQLALKLWRVSCVGTEGQPLRWRLLGAQILERSTGGKGIGAQLLNKSDGTKALARKIQPRETAH